MEDNERKVKVH